MGASTLQRALAQQPAVELAREEEEVAWPLLHGLLAHQPMPSRNITEAWLAALCLSKGLRLVSFDAGFGRFNGLDWLQLQG